MHSEKLRSRVLEIYESQRDHFHAQLIAKGYSEDIASEGIQNGTLKILELVNNGRNLREEDLAGYFFRTCVTCTIDVVRREMRAHRRLIDMEDIPVWIPSSDPDPADIVIDIEFSDRLQSSFHQLEQTEQQIIALSLNEYSMREIGDFFGISEGAAKSRLHRARVQMRSYAQER